MVENLGQSSALSESHFSRHVSSSEAFESLPLSETQITTKEEAARFCSCGVITDILSSRLIRNYRAGSIVMQHGAETRTTKKARSNRGAHNGAGVR